MAEAYQNTFTGDKIPIKKKEDKRYGFQLVNGYITWNIYKYICRTPFPVTETQIQERFPGPTIGNKLRKLRSGGYIKDIKRSGRPQVWVEDK